MATLICASILPGAARAQAPADDGALKLSGDVRLLSGAPGDPVYGSLTAEKGIREGRSVVVRVVVSEKKTYSGDGFRILHGGNDAEIALREKRGGGVWEIGLARPDTAERQNYLQGTLRYRTERGRWILEPRAVFSKGGTLAGVGVRRESPWGADRTVFVEATPVIVGNNDRSLATGNSRRTALWGVGVRHKNLTLGVTNALGATTGMSLTPQLRGAAIFVRVEVIR